MTIPPAIAARLRSLTIRRSGNHTCCCPVHADQHPSAIISVAPNGAIVLTCMVCKARYDRQTFFRLLCESTGTDATEWFDPLTRPARHAGTSRRRTRAMRRITRTFPYVDQHGELIMEICRFDSGDPKCLPRRPARPDDPQDAISVDKDGSQWVWAGPLAGDEPFDVLYRLPELLAADKSRMVFVTEGEPDADELAELGFVSVTNAFGAGHWSDHQSKWLVGRHICICEDNDHAGRRRTQDLFGSLAVAGAATIRVMRFADMPEKADVSDWLNLPAMQLFGDDVKRQEVINRVNGCVMWVAEGNAIA